MELFHAALRPSSQKTYRTGQRAYTRFLNSIDGGIRLPFQGKLPGKTELNLAFFIAFLLLEPNIKKSSTILNYESHVKYMFREEGCPEEMMNTPFLRQVRKGLKNTLPESVDQRRPLLLPLIMSRPQFRTTVSDDQRLLKLATILGFVGMLRPHTLQELNLASFTVVTTVGEEKPMPNQGQEF